MLMQKGKNLTKSLSMEEKYNYNAFLILIRCRNCICIFTNCPRQEFPERCKIESTATDECMNSNHVYFE